MSIFGSTLHHCIRIKKPVKTMAHIQLVLVVFLFSACVPIINAGFTTTKLGPKPIWNNTHTDKLKQDLLLNYDKFARPMQHFNKTTVRFGMTIMHVELNEFKSTFSVHCWLHLEWKDEKLKWNESDYGGLEVLHLAEHEVWQPDIYLYNSATSTPVNQYGNTNCLVYPSGSVLWVPPAEFTVLCDLNLKYWPFDTQECSMKFGSWTYHGDEIDLETFNQATEATKDLIVDSTEWMITETSQKKSETYYPCCKEPYPDITVNITLSRISPSYKAVIVTPAFVIIVMILLSFWLPPHAGEKILLNASTAIIICLYMLYFTQKLPAMGTHTPLIVLFYSSCLYIVSFSMIGSVIVISLSRTKHSNSLPWVIKQPLTGTVGKLLGLSSYIQQSTMSTHRVTAEEMRDHQVTDFDDNNSGDEHHIIRSSLNSTKPSLQQDWILLAAAIDRISFIFYCLLFLILAIVYSV